MEGWGTGDMIAGVGSLEGARGLSSAQIKRRVGLASITLLIGPHLSARRGVGSGWQKCASWHGDHRHPRCSAVISHPQSPSLHPSRPGHFSALPSRLRCASASSPTSTLLLSSFSPFVPCCAYLASRLVCSLFAIHLNPLTRSSSHCIFNHTHPTRLRSLGSSVSV